MASNISPGKTILVIEDHPGEREGLAALLRAEGYGVSPVASVDEGLACLRSGGVDLVLLGMMLPGKDGWYFLSQRLRDRALAAVPVLITTSLHVACQEWARSLGAQGCFRKPLNVAALLEEVRRLTAGP